MWKTEGKKSLKPRHSSQVITNHKNYQTFLLLPQKGPMLSQGRPDKDRSYVTSTTQRCSIRYRSESLLIRSHPKQTQISKPSQDSQR
jgi:hypothetical protein